MFIRCSWRFLVAWLFVCLLFACWFVRPSPLLLFQISLPLRRASVFPFSYNAVLLGQNPIRALAVVQVERRLEKH